MCSLCPILGYLIPSSLCSSLVQLTSSNSSWNGSWKLKLGGFSLATFVTEPLSLVCGTPYYMAPEMLMETGWARHMQLGLYHIRLNTSVSYCCRYGTKIDVWSAGVICYILLSGIMPFRRYTLTKCTNHCMWSISLHINLRKSNTDMFANIKSGKFSFPSPFWDHVSEEAKVSRPSHLLSMHLKTGQLDFQATQVFNPLPSSPLHFWHRTSLDTCWSLPHRSATLQVRCYNTPG